MLRNILLAATLVTAGAATAQVPLGQQSEITEGLIAVAIAYEIGDKCGSIDARWLRGIGVLNSLQSRAEALGYSRAEVQAFIDNRDEKQRLETEARARLVEMGAVVGDWESYCVVGRAEIAAGSPVGQLLR